MRMDTPDDVKKVVRISILNQTYTVTTSGDPRATELLAEGIDELMSSIARRAGNLDSTRTAVLACLHLADRLRSAEEELDELKLSVRHKSRDFAMLLDQALVEQHLIEIVPPLPDAPITDAAQAGEDHTAQDSLWHTEEGGPVEPPIS
jgi:cell division protein ZapA